jgi:mitogen-activated protein kinase kinase
MKAFHLSRQGTPPGRAAGGASSTAEPISDSSNSGSSPSPSQSQSPNPSHGAPPMAGLAGGMRLPPNLRPTTQTFVSAPAVPKAKGGLSERRGMKLPGGLPGLPGGDASNGSSSSKSGSDGGSQPNGNGHTGSMFNQFSKYVDTKKGTLNFAGKAVIHGQGIDFTGGSNFSISLDEVDTLEELGKGNYGTVYKVRHARPKIRRPGLGLAGNKAPAPMTPSPEKEGDVEPPSKGSSSTTNVVMAMKEIRLELDEAKFAAIIMELDVLHRCVSPYIIDFYGAFFQEGAVYICIEFMDGGSIDKLYSDGVPENILRKITYATTQGLKALKDEHNIIHRDVKPTNILVNTRGQVKICDFGVSGNLVASIAKTNIGCQSYMAPERISGGGVAAAGANAGGGTYSAQSDIWSLGLSIIECAMGRYPYPPETYDNIFSQLSVSSIYSALHYRH